MQADGGSGNPDVIEPGAWLLAYWMGRYHGYITAPPTADPVLLQVERIGRTDLGAKPYVGRRGRHCLIKCGLWLSQPFLKFHPDPADAWPQSRRVGASAPTFPVTAEIAARTCLSLSLSSDKSLTRGS